MRTKGEGSVTQRKDGRWMARFFVTGTDGTKRRVHILRKTRDEALQAMKQEQQLASIGKPVVHDGRTVSDWLDYWFANIAPTKVRRTTLTGYEQHIRRQLKPAIGHKTLIELTPMDVQTMINNFIKKGGSARMAQISRNVLSAALRDAMRRDLIHRNVARLVDVPQDIHKERGVWLPEHISKFLAHIKGHPLHPLFEMYFTYGMRKGEALGLRWCDIDFETKTIHIRQQLTGMGKDIFIAEPKTNAGKRDLPLLPHIRELLIRLRDKVPDADPYSLIFQSRRGTPCQPNNVFRVFRRETRALGLPVISIHDIRHTVATLMKDNDVPVKDAQMTLGHASVQTTMQIYQHSSLENKNNALISIARAVTR